MSEYFSPSPVELDPPAFGSLELDIEETEDQIDTFVADALQQMTPEERERILFEQHGVSDKLAEDPEMVAQRLEEMETHLQKLKGKRGVPSAAFELAESKSPHYCKEPTFRLQFLRSESFHAKKAAGRMIRFFDFKRMLFGDDKICKAITMEDLEPEDVVALKKGFMQALPSRDAAGRIVFVFFANHLEYQSNKSLGRLFLHMNTRNEDFSQQGIVMIIYHMGKFRFSDFDRKSIYMGSRSCSDLPVKIAAFHYCMNDKKERLIISFVMRFFSKENRAKSKVHFGTHQECMYSLMTYGIPHSLFPVSPEGEIKRKNHLDLLQMRGIVEDYAKSGTEIGMIEIPRNTDVLLGKGKPIQEHLGNMRLHLLVDQQLPRYDSCSKKEKTELATEIIQMVKASAGRVLTQESGVWTEVSDDIARQKVSNLFRNRRKMAKKEAARPQNQTRITGVGVRTELPGSFMVQNNDSHKRAKVV